MDKTFLHHLRTVVMIMDFKDQELGLYFDLGGFEETDEHQKNLGDLLDPYATEYSSKIGALFNDAQIYDIDSLKFESNIHSGDTLISGVRSGGLLLSEHEEFQQLVPQITKLSSEMFLGMCDEIDGEMGVMHQRKAPTVEFVEENEYEEKGVA